LPVRGKVADGRVELEQADFQWRQVNCRAGFRNEFARAARSQGFCAAGCKADVGSAVSTLCRASASFPK
jgi:hypothetical protein